MALLHRLFEKTQCYVPFVCTYVLSQNCVYWVYITHIIEYNVSAHLRHTFIASHNQKLGYFWNLGHFKAKIVYFEYPPPLIFFGISCIHRHVYIITYTRPQYPYSETKYVHTCGTHFILQLQGACVSFGCTYFVSLYISERLI